MIKYHTDLSPIMQAIQREEEMFTERKKEMTAEHEQVGAVEREDATHHQEVPNAIKRTMSTVTPMPLHDVRNMQRCASEAADVTMPPMTVNAIDALARHIELPIVCKRHDMAVKALEMGRELMAKLCTPVRDGVSKSIAALEAALMIGTQSARKILKQVLALLRSLKSKVGNVFKPFRFVRKDKNKVNLQQVSNDAVDIANDKKTADAIGCNNGADSLSPDLIMPDTAVDDDNVLVSTVNPWASLDLLFPDEYNDTIVDDAKPLQHDVTCPIMQADDKQIGEDKTESRQSALEIVGQCDPSNQEKKEDDTTIEDVSRHAEELHRANNTLEAVSHFADEWNRVDTMLENMNASVAALEELLFEPWATLFQQSTDNGDVIQVEPIRLFSGGKSVHAENVMDESKGELCGEVATSTEKVHRVSFADSAVESLPPNNDAGNAGDVWFEVDLD